MNAQSKTKFFRRSDGVEIEPLDIKGNWQTVEPDGSLSFYLDSTEVLTVLTNDYGVQRIDYCDRTPTAHCNTPHRESSVCFSNSKKLNQMNCFKSCLVYPGGIFLL